MRKYIGLRSGINLLIFRTEQIESLKQQALLFDQIGILELSKYLENNATLSTEEIGELQWLVEQELVCNLVLKPFDGRDQAGQVAQLFEAAMESYAHTQNYEALIRASGIKGKSPLNDRWYRWRAALESVLLRLLAFQTETLENANAVPLLSYSEFLGDVPTTRMTDVAHLIINRLPLPDQTTAWEDILDYRNDSGSQQSLLSLRRWMRKMSEENLSANEIEEELQWLINEFETHMKVHRIKSTDMAMEIILKVPLELLENLVKLNFSKLPDPLFAIKKRELSLMEAEITAPGKEIAYIVKTGEAFSASELP